MAEVPVALIEVPAGAGTLNLEMTSPAFPQTLAGVLWRYGADKKFEAKAGVFTPKFNSVPIGAIAANRGKFYVLEGVVLHHNDPRPVPYQVLVSLIRDSRALHTEVPPEGGSGEIKDADVPFLYRFQLMEATA